MKKIVTLLMLALFIMASLVLSGCGSDEGAAKKVSITFANSSDSWKRNGENMKKLLEDEGFVVDLQFADTDSQQIEQLQKMIADKPKCIVIGAVNSTNLADVLEDAKKAEIPIIAYDRLIMNSDAISYYASFDNEAVGSAMGQYIESALNLKTGAGPFNIEVFAGDPNDNNAHLFFSGAMDVLKPYIDKGQLVCRSGELSFDKAATKDWDGKNAAARMTKLYSQYYAGSQIDVVLSPNDGVAEGIRQGLSAAGYSGKPIITGQDADSNAIKAVKEGEQTITIFKDPEQLGTKCVRMIKAVVEGTEPAINDVTTYNNGKIVVPSYLCIPYIIDKGNTNSVEK